MNLIHCRAFFHTSSRGGLPQDKPLPDLWRALPWIIIFMNEKNRRREARTRSLLLMPSNNANILWMISDDIWRVAFWVLLFLMECTGEKKNLFQQKFYLTTHSHASLCRAQSRQSAESHCSSGVVLNLPNTVTFWYSSSCYSGPQPQINFVATW